MKVQLNKELCTGHARCQQCCPEVFGSDDEGFAVLLMNEIPERLQEDTEIAVANCPEQALSITED